MVINHLCNRDLCDCCQVDTSVGYLGDGIVVGEEDESVLPPEVHGEVAGPVGAEGMALSRRLVHVPEGGRGAEGRQTSPEKGPVVGSPIASASFVAGAALLQLAVGPRDVDDGSLFV